MSRTEETNHNIEGQMLERDDEGPSEGPPARKSKRVRRISAKLLIDCDKDVDWVPMGFAGGAALKESELKLMEFGMEESNNGPSSSRKRKRFADVHVRRRRSPNSEDLWTGIRSPPKTPLALNQQHNKKVSSVVEPCPSSLPGKFVVLSEQQCVTKPVELQFGSSNPPTSNLTTVMKCHRNITPKQLGQQIAIEMEDEDSYDVTRIEKFLDAGAHVNSRIANTEGLTLLMKAVELRSLYLVHTLCRYRAKLDMRDNFGATALMLAGAYDKSEIVRYLVGIGADPYVQMHSTGMTCLHVMAKDDNVLAAKALDLPKRMGLLEVQDDKKCTPLATACRFGSTRMVTFLAELISQMSLNRIVSIVDSHGGTALHWGAFKGNVEVVMTLISLGADTNAQDKDGNTPMHIVVSTIQSRRIQMLEVLLTSGAEPAIQNAAGKSVTDMCDSNLLKILEKLLRNVELSGYCLNPPSLFSLEDLSLGYESRFAIPCVNHFDSATLAYRKDFIYITEPIRHGDICLKNFHYCDCSKTGCESGKCSPYKMSSTTGLRLCYDESGRVLLPEQGKSFPVDAFELYECGQLCSCNAKKCQNRVVQQGLSKQLEVFRTDTTESKGWGVRTLQKIGRNEFVSELVGEIFPADYFKTSNRTKSHESFLYQFKIDESEIYVDCGKYGNVSRFINHSCDPNLFPVKVFVHSCAPRLAFFARTDILPKQELTFDYTMFHSQFQTVENFPFRCKCKSLNCRGKDIA